MPAQQYHERRWEPSIHSGSRRPRPDSLDTQCTAVQRIPSIRWPTPLRHNPAFAPGLGPAGVENLLVRANQQSFHCGHPSIAALRGA